MKDFLYRITRSSVDPEKMALTVKGAILALVPTIIALAPMVCTAHIVCLDPNSVAPFADMLISIVQGVAGVVAGIMLVIGIMRKLFAGQWSAS